MALQHANDANFAGMIGNGITLVDFWAVWCGPCRMFGPIFESVSEKLTDVNDNGRQELGKTSATRINHGKRNDQKHKYANRNRLNDAPLNLRNIRRSAGFNQGFVALGGNLGLVMT